MQEASGANTGKGNSLRKTGSTVACRKSRAFRCQSRRIRRDAVSWRNVHTTQPAETPESCGASTGCFAELTLVRGTCSLRRKTLWRRPSSRATMLAEKAAEGSECECAADMKTGLSNTASVAVRRQRHTSGDLQPLLEDHARQRTQEVSVTRPQKRTFPLRIWRRESEAYSETLASYREV